MFCSHNNYPSKVLSFMHNICQVHFILHLKHLHLTCFCYISRLTALFSFSCSHLDCVLLLMYFIFFGLILTCTRSIRPTSGIDNYGKIFPGFVFHYQGTGMWQQPISGRFVCTITEGSTEVGPWVWCYRYGQKRQRTTATPSLLLQRRPRSAAARWLRRISASATPVPHPSTLPCALFYLC